MARYYHLATFLQHAPNALIKAYLESRKITNNLVWGNREERNIDDIYDFLQGLDARKVEINSDFEKINDLACPSAERAIYQACHSLNQAKIISILDQIHDRYQRVMWLFLNHDDMFSLAMKFDKIRCGSWKYCAVGTKHKLKYDQKRCDDFKESVKNFYQFQGDARYCKVKHYELDDSHYFFAYPEGKAEIMPQYGHGEDDIKNLTVRKLCEIIFIYNNKTGILKTNVHGTKEEIATLQGNFCISILGMDSAPEKDNVIFKLDILRAPGFEFALEDDEINVDGVKLKEIRFVVDKTTKNRVLITLDSKSSYHDYSQVLSSVALVNNQTLLNAEIDYVKMQFIMRKPPKGKRPNLTFEMTLSSATLEDGETDNIVRKYLEKWEIMQHLEFGEDNLELAKADELAKATE